MTDIYKKTELLKLLRRHEFTMSKSLGQNFLIDRNIIEKIAESLNIGEDDRVVEVGAGAGVLTKELAQRAKSVKAVEIDSKLLPILKEVLKDVSNVEIIAEDFMKVDMGDLSAGKSYKLIGNLPYYITTPIIMKALESEHKPKISVFMVQKEVAQRLSARAGTKDYGSITVAANYYARVEYLFGVSKEVFIPKPKVDSAVIWVTPYDRPPIKSLDEKMFFAVVKACFGQRRKTLSNSLKQIKSLDPSYIKEVLAQAGIDPARRAETLEISEFARLSDSVTLLLKNKS